MGAFGVSEGPGVGADAGEGDAGFAVGVGVAAARGAEDGSVVGSEYRSVIVVPFLVFLTAGTGAGRTPVSGGRAVWNDGRKRRYEGPCSCINLQTADAMG